MPSNSPKSYEPSWGVKEVKALFKADQWEVLTRLLTVERDRLTNQWLGSESNEDDRVLKNLIRFISHLIDGGFEASALQSLEQSGPATIEDIPNLGYDTMRLDSSGTIKEIDPDG